ncbi:gag protease polyprotein [Cucumis melo var. makuwa]|uniref:Gag protease polyprotein n=1 Tax=Cucumis melo var. makuwa TaxID=1194695 RepID=A0A5A7ULN8_CUCMM|nr:gag protease polyprotein [Cucumis melo var. makuwa]TYJ99945.1 gag protease polyprotein [Cucumis melo var. makuwa]
MVANEAARIDKSVRGLRLDLQGFVRAFKLATHADALRLVVDGYPEPDFHFSAGKSIYHYSSGGQASWHNSDKYAPNLGALQTCVV